MAKGDMLNQEPKAERPNARKKILDMLAEKPEGELLTVRELATGVRRLFPGKDVRDLMSQVHDVLKQLGEFECVVKEELREKRGSSTVGYRITDKGREELRSGQLGREYINRFPIEDEE